MRPESRNWNTGNSSWSLLAGIFIAASAGNELWVWWFQRVAGGERTSTGASDHQGSRCTQAPEANFRVTGIY